MINNLFCLERQRDEEESKKRETFIKIVEKSKALE